MKTIHINNKTNTLLNFIFNRKSEQEVKKQYNIPDEIKLHFQITPDGWFLITSPDLPGLITQARNAKELLKMVNDAVLTYYDVPRREADEILNTINIEGFGKICSQPQKTLQPA